jgi:hypothetical protein
MMKLIIISLLVGLVMATGCVGNQQDDVSWTPVDGVWVYDSNGSGILFFLTYKSDLGEYEVVNVNATTWYNFMSLHGGVMRMRFQGGS